MIPYFVLVVTHKLVVVSFSDGTLLFTIGTKSRYISLDLFKFLQIICLDFFNFFCNNESVKGLRHVSIFLLYAINGLRDYEALVCPEVSCPEVKRYCYARYSWLAL